MRKPYDSRNPPKWTSEADVLESLRALWDHAQLSQSAVDWFWSASPNTTEEGRKRASEALRMIAFRCRCASNAIGWSPEEIAEWKRLGIDW